MESTHRGHEAHLQCFLGFLNERRYKIVCLGEGGPELLKLSKIVPEYRAYLDSRGIVPPGTGGGFDGELFAWMEGSKT